MAPRLTAALIAQNEARHIVPCLRTLHWADEVLVLDGGSIDGTPELARAAGATVYERPFDNFAAQRQALIDLATGDWILFVDVDERVSTPLAAEIRNVIANTAEDGPVGYWIPRRNYIWGRWIRGGGWYPDHQLRLLRRGRVGYDLERPVHELVDVQGETARLRCAFVHYNYETIRQFVQKQHRYASLEARAVDQTRTAPSPRRLFTAPLREAWRRYVALDGRRDGWRGVLLALLTALGAAETQLRLIRR